MESIWRATIGVFCEDSCEGMLGSGQNHRSSPHSLLATIRIHKHQTRPHQYNKLNNLLPITFNICNSFVHIGLLKLQVHLRRLGDHKNVSIALEEKYRQAHPQIQSSFLAFVLPPVSLSSLILSFLPLIQSYRNRTGSLYHL